MKYVFGPHQRPQEQFSFRMAVSDVLAAVCLVILLLTFIALATAFMPVGV